jgi:hypothetical protein
MEKFIIVNVHNATLKKNPKIILKMFFHFFLGVQKQIHVKNNGLNF